MAVRSGTKEEAIGDGIIAKDAAKNDPTNEKIDRGDLEWDVVPPKENMGVWTQEEVDAYSQTDESFIERGALEKIAWVSDIVFYYLFPWALWGGIALLFLYEVFFEGF